ncbi:YggS family pyridoxal phosphate-dependent enzyme [Kineothrix sp. MB12-C1]|uniref:YggS family pyridoxal phosphate-dependent enzyme n=1 Tax=Kineothrix sp. MB12-C1 TaxID=3070215 RepID=UPI0027D2DFC4|nr:YggS family pyridoxal phosphate-dependent enzyme [Kineothrix sp. MB12-C1]WMC92772.1 YggS family pyridoxal phosphate-dependent enzyme [Kineothrix sp. MB12-C1]
MSKKEIHDNLMIVEKKIQIACRKAERAPEEVQLIAVSKTMPVSVLLEAYECGCRHFGENKVQELVEKYEQMPKDIKWHMIGHLQRNKVKYIIDKVALIHSVDSLKLAEEISKEAVKKNVIAHILIEVNIAQEETKFGVAKDEAAALIESIAKLPSIKVEGLMTIAPYVENPEENRRYFAGLRQLSVDIMEKNNDNVNMNVLSMGMTGDYEVAVEEGATYARVGTGIFGSRHYNG